MKRGKKATNVTVLEEDDFKYVPKKKSQLFEDIQYEFRDDSEDEGPVIVNADEFNRALPQERPKSPSPPRRTVVESDDEDIVYRDKSGKRITKEQWLLNQKKGKSAKDEPRQELVWGKGLVQKENLEQKKRDEEKIASEPLNRYDIDDAYDEELRNRQRWSDPLAKRQVVEQVTDDTPRCRFPGVPNRFSIQPGYRWDGVIRGNGYEDRWFKAQADRNVKKQKYYINNIADM